MANEQYGFVFAVLYIILFAGLTSMIPVELQGSGSAPTINTPVDPALTSDFADSETFTESDFSGILSLYYVYDGDLDSMGYTFECVFDLVDTFFLGSHVLWFGLWLGAYDWVTWKSPNGTVYGTTGVSFSDIDNDMTEGVVRYDLTFSGSGQDAGGLVFYYNTTLYSDASDAWDNDALTLLHGIGFVPNSNIVSLLIGLLFLQIPDIPIGIQLLINSPFYASVVYILWYIIKESLPF